MTEWYLIEQFNAEVNIWFPERVVMGRREAIDQIVQDRNTSTGTRKLFSNFMENPAPALGDALEFAGRRAVRVLGPGSEV